MQKCNSFFSNAYLNTNQLTNVILNLRSQERIIKKCLKKHKKSQIELYKLYCDAMFLVSLRIVRQKETAQEIMQDAFIIAFDKLDLYDAAKGSFGSWLKRIVVNQSISFLRKEKDIVFKSLELVPELILESDIEQNNALPEQYEKFKKGFAELKTNYQVIINLHYIEGYDLEEIGQILDISYANTRTMLSRARQSLKKKVELV